MPERRPDPDPQGAESSAIAPAPAPNGPPARPSAEDDRAGHRRRLREKFLKAGLNAFLDYEVIEILLTLGTPRKDCKDSARQALREFRTLRGVLEADARDLLRIRGIGAHNVFGIRLVQEVSRRFLKDRMLSRPFCRSSGEVFDYLYHSMRDLRKEHFKVLFLDPKNQILEEKTLFEGTVDSSAVRRHGPDLRPQPPLRRSGSLALRPGDHPRAGLCRPGHAAQGARPHRHRQQPVLQLRRSRADRGIRPAVHEPASLVMRIVSSFYDRKSI